MMIDTNTHKDFSTHANYLAKLYVFFEAGSWMMSFPFYCSSISYEKFSAIYCSKDTKSNSSSILSFLKPDNTYTVQIDPINPELIFPISKIKLLSITEEEDLIKIEGLFTETSKEMIDAVNQIKLSDSF